MGVKRRQFVARGNAVDPSIGRHLPGKPNRVGQASFAPSSKGSTTQAWRSNFQGGRCCIDVGTNPMFPVGLNGRCKARGIGQHHFRGHGRKRPFVAPSRAVIHAKFDAPNQDDEIRPAISVTVPVKQRQAVSCSHARHLGDEHAVVPVDRARQARHPVRASHVGIAAPKHGFVGTASPIQRQQLPVGLVAPCVGGHCHLKRQRIARTGKLGTHTRRRKHRKNNGPHKARRNWIFHDVREDRPFLTQLCVHARFAVPFQNAQPHAMSTW